MIPVDLLKRVSVVYVHANCPDGLASAMILQDAFRMLGMAPSIEFLSHDTPEHKLAGSTKECEAHRHLRGGDGVPLFCDIAPHPEAVFAMTAATLSDCIVLDHHKGAEKLVRSFARGVFADEKLDLGVSGAVLAEREVWSVIEASDERCAQTVGILPVQQFAAAVGCRDTWQTKAPLFMFGQWISKMLMSKTASYWLTRTLSDSVQAHRHPPYLREDEIAAGRALFEAHEHAVAQAAEGIVERTASVYDWKGDRVAGPLQVYVFQEQSAGFRLTSDVAEALRRKHGDAPAIVAGFAWHDAEDMPFLLWSLRGIGGVDVSALAREYGGNGHTAAAGFRLVGAPSVSPFEWIRAAVYTWLCQQKNGATR